MRERRGGWRWLFVLAIVAVVAGCGAGCAATGASSDPDAARVRRDGATGRPVPTAAADQDPARFATKVVRHARRAGISPRLLMAILYNESYKPHDPARERAWQQIEPDAAFGIANMHKAAFDDTKRGRDFASRDWEELPDDPDLAIEAAAWYLHDLAAQLPRNRSGRYTKDELLALGYNAGPGNMKAFARGARPGRLAQSYLDRLHRNWAAAEEAIRHR